MQGTIAVAVIFATALFLIVAVTKILTLPGALAMWCMGFVIYLATGWRGLAIAVLFFVLGSVVTRVGYERKRARGSAEKNEGRRGAREVLAKGTVPTLCAAPLVFGGSPLFLIGYVGAWATALCDTSATELGSLWAKRTVSLRTLGKVPPGTSGGVSLEGTLAGFVAALALVSAAAGLGLTRAGLIVPLAGAAVAASLVESLLGGSIPAGLAMRHELLNLANTAAGGGFAILCGALLARA